MTTIGWLLILTALIIAQSVVRGRVMNLGQDLSDAFRSLATGDTTSFSEVIGRKGNPLDYQIAGATVAEGAQEGGLAATLGAGIAEGAGWKLDAHLASIVATVKAAHPGMTVGTIGDAAHKARQSDHNPDSKGIVHAADFMIGAHFTASDAASLANQFANSGDPQIKYVIYNRHIWENGKWRAYHGSDPHTNHVHLSVR